MRRITATRLSYGPWGILAKAFVNGRIMYFLEPPWRDNEKRVSAIPEGEYRCTYLPVSPSGKWRDVYHIQDVPQRTAVYVHAGNVIEDTMGCPLVGMEYGYRNRELFLIRSREAMRRLHGYVGRRTWYLTLKQIEKIKL